MTHNQIDLAKLKEEVRHNQEMETINKTTNDINQSHYLRADTVSQAQVAELQRHNYVGEQQEWVQKGINANQAAAAMASAAASGLSAQASMLNASTNALLAPSTEAYNWAHAADTQSHVGVNQSTTSKNVAQQGLIHSQQYGQDIANVFNIQTADDRARSIKLNNINTGTQAYRNVVEGSANAYKSFQQGKTDKSLRNSQKVLNYSQARSNWSNSNRNAANALKGVVGLFLK